MTSAADAAQVKKQNRGLKASIIAVAIALLAALVALALTFTGILQIPGFSQAQGEIVLQGADEQGRDAFSVTALATPAASTTPATQAQPLTTSVPAAVSGGTVGLYGGTGDNSRCDPGQLISFLGSEPAKAQAFVDALNADPNLRWKNNDPLTTADIPAYVAQLTSLVLLSDTVVTNHGFSGNQATPFQSVLQAGTAVLVDRFGVPRSRCICGNPLIPADPLPATPTITGDPWPGFDISTTVVIVETEITINVFEAVSYPNGGSLVNIPAGLCDPANPSTCASPWTAVSTNPPVVTPAPTTPTAPAPSTPPTTTPTDPNSVAEVPPAGLPASSSGNEPAVTITIQNTSNVPVDVWWSDFNGNPVFYGRLLPGESYDQDTFHNHVWALTSGDSTPITLCTVAGPGTCVA